MDLYLLRRRFVFAMGLPALGATWAACAAPKPAVPPDVPGGGAGTLQVAGGEAPDGETGPTLVQQGSGDVQVATGDAPCGADEVRERVCGSVASPDVRGQCGSYGDSLVAYGTSQLPLTKFTGSSHDPAFRKWPLSEPATESYRATLDGVAAQARHNYCCYESCTALRAGDRGQSSVPTGFVPGQRCVPAPSSTKHPAPGGGTCPAAIELDGAMRALASSGGAQCCYLYPQPAPRPDLERRHNRGRPLRVNGAPVLAGAEERDDWRSSGAPSGLAPSGSVTSQLALSRLAPSALGLSGEERSLLAAAWREEARMEHASIAAFARLSLQLLALGAPPALVRDAHQAAMEEVDHAQIAFSLASAYGGAPLGPGRLEEAASSSQERATLVTLVEETLLDGCVGETVAAVEAACAAEAATDVTIADALRAIAADETSHAELGFRIVAWAVKQAKDDVSPVIARALAELRSAIEAEPAAPAGRSALADHGVLGEGERARIRHEVIRDVVIPAIAALVEGRPSESTEATLRRAMA